MKKLLSIFAGVVAVTAVYLTVADTPAPQAADHAESAAISANGAADIADHYAWTRDIDVDDTYDDSVVLAMTVNPNAAANAKLADAIEYKFYLNASDNASPGTDYTVTCTYDATGDEITCSLVGGSTNASVTADWDTAKTDGAFSVYAGVREDSFFFNGYGFNQTVQYTVANAGGLTFNADGCPDLSGGDGALLRACITNSECAALGGADQAPANSFANANIIALVVEIPAALIPGGPVLKSWAATVNP